MLEKLPVLFACALYLGSFILPAMVHEDGKAELGYEVFAFTSKFLLFGFSPIWLANPTYWISTWMALRGKWKEALCWGLLSLYLASSSSGPLRLSVGYYFWLMGIATPVLVSTAHFLKDRTTRQMVRRSFCTSGSAVVMGLVAYGNLYWLLVRWFHESPR